jgi:hypothetical protein
MNVPAFIENNIVWGATAMMLSELKEVLKTVLAIRYSILFVFSAVSQLL